MLAPQFAQGDPGLGQAILELVALIDAAYLAVVDRAPIGAECALVGPTRQSELRRQRIVLMRAPHALVARLLLARAVGLDLLDPVAAVGRNGLRDFVAPQQLATLFLIQSGQPLAEL